MTTKKTPTASFDPIYVSFAKRTSKLKQKFNGVLPPLAQESDLIKFLDTQNKVDLCEYFEEIMDRCNHLPLHEAFEPVLSIMFNSERTITWISENSSFYSPTLHKSIHNPNSLLSSAALAGIPIHSYLSDDSVCKDFMVDKNYHHLFIPLLNMNGVLFGVCHLTRLAFFKTKEIANAQFLVNKYRLYTTAMLASTTAISLSSSVATILSPKDCFMQVETSLCKTFKAQMADVWILKDKQFLRFDRDRGLFSVTPKKATGLVGYSLITRQSIIERKAKHHSNYSEEIDGYPDLPVMVCLCEFDELVYAVALRGKTEGTEFNGVERHQLNLIIPFAARSFAYSCGFSDIAPKKASTGDEKLLRLLDFAETLTHIKAKHEVLKSAVTLVATLMQCEGVLIDSVDGRFNRVYLGKEIEVKIPVENPDKGWINNNSEEWYQNCIGVPIYDRENHVIAWLIGYSRKSSGFTEDDIDMMNAFAVYISISFMNAVELESLIDDQI